MSELADALQERIIRQGANVVAKVTGEARDAALALRKLTSQDASIDVIACTEATGGWLLFADFATDFPNFAKATFVTPESLLLADVPDRQEPA